MRRKFRVRAYWEVYAEVEVEAENLDEAIVNASDTINIDRDGTYVDGSFEIERDNAVEISPVFVFGSNLAGRHGLGAARRAHEAYGAEMGVGEGMTGNSYAIPTKDENLNVLPLEAIKLYVNRFKAYAHKNSDLKFYVTKIGCGLAGYKEEEIAPLFDNCPWNCELRFFEEEELI